MLRTSIGYVHRYQLNASAITSSIIQYVLKWNNILVLQLTPQCLSELRTAFENAEERYSKPGTAFFVACDETGGFDAPSAESPEAEEIAAEEKRNEQVAAPLAEENDSPGNSATSAVITPIALFLLINAILMLSTF